MVSAQNSTIQKCQRAKLPHKVCSRVPGYVFQYDQLYACDVFVYEATLTPVVTCRIEA